MQKYRVTIPKRGSIPGIGNGPINKPVYISVQKYNQLIKCGFPVNIVSNSIDEAKIISNSLPTNTNKVVEETVVEPEPTVEPTVETENTTEEVVEETVEEAEEPVVEEETVVKPENTTEEVVEILVDDENYSAEAFYNEEFLTTKNVCKKILDNRKVSYDTSASLSKLKSLVLESNPVVEEN